MFQCYGDRSLPAETADQIERGIQPVCWLRPKFIRGNPPRVEEIELLPLCACPDVAMKRFVRAFWRVMAERDIRQGKEGRVKELEALAEFSHAELDQLRRDHLR